MYVIDLYPKLLERAKTVLCYRVREEDVLRIPNRIGVVANEGEQAGDGRLDPLGESLPVVEDLEGWYVQ